MPSAGVASEASRADCAGCAEHVERTAGCVLAEEALSGLRTRNARHPGGSNVQIAQARSSIVTLFGLFTETLQLVGLFGYVEFI